MNTEEMMAEIARVNADGLRENTVIGSTDVKALYPSLDIDFTISKVCEVFKESDVLVSGVDYDELGLYLRLTRSNDDINTLLLADVCPTRRSNRGQYPTITSSGTAAKKVDRFKPWLPAATVPDAYQQREMLTEALRVGLEVVMKNHVYEFDGEVRHQQRGGPIGVELTGNIAQVFMIWWDRSLISRLTGLGIELRMCKRYVDDVNLAMNELPLGTRYSNGTVSIDDGAIEEDLHVPGDKRTMDIVKAIGNSVHPSIQLEVDVPSNHPDNRMPILDLKVWVETTDGVTKIVHEYYAKEVSSNAVIHAQSALSWQVKRSVLSQEVLRVLLNCSEDVPWEDKARHASKMVLRMQYCGYTKKFRYEVVASALKAYDAIQEHARNGERPLYRPYEWNREERDREKSEKRLGWYRKGGYESVIFVPSTPRSELQQKYQREIDRHGLRIRAVERGGRTVKSSLQRSNPFRSATCGRQSCFVCETEGRGSCEKEGVTYEIECASCKENGERAVYIGETSKNAYTRGKKHLQDLDGKLAGSVMWRHCREKHDSCISDFTMGVTGHCRNDSMLRQISEAVRIHGSSDNELINNKTEWNFVTFPRVVVDNGEAADR